MNKYFIISNDYWAVVIIVVMVIVLLTVLLLLAKKLRHRNRRIISKDKAIANEIDMDNIINSAFNAQSLYNELKKVCHPDRFLDIETKQKADILFQEITENKKNIKRLQELKVMVEEELNIKF